MDSELTDKILQGDRRALSKALTLVDSQNHEHIPEIRSLVNHLLDHTGNSIRLGITGAPGVGKSTFIEALGMQFIHAGLKVAVLTIDPTSPMSGGSILGDKTRMNMLSEHPNAMVRPSPSGRFNGGIGNNTRDQILVCEAAGFEVVIVETVGSGQGETAIESISDMLLLLLQPGGGDDLQGIKRGIMELADCFVFNKMDATDPSVLRTSMSDLTNALQLLQGGSKSRVMACSSTEGNGISEIFEHISNFHGESKSSGELNSKRDTQNILQYDLLLKNHLIQRAKNHPDFDKITHQAREEVKNNKSTPLSAVEWTLDNL